MSAPVANVYNDFSGLAKLRVQARQDGQGALREVAQQFEAVFTQMLLKSMRSASLGDGIFDSEQSKSYQDMFDQQLSVTMAAGGKGMGIADMLARQLGNITPAAVDALSMPQRNTFATSQPVAATTTGKDLPNTIELAVRRAMSEAKQAAEVPIAIAHTVAAALPGNPLTFLHRIAPHAKAAADAMGVSLRAVLSQVALETGWGKHVPAKSDGQSSFNLFGIKAGANWDGDRVVKATAEFERGSAVQRNEAFRAYDSPVDAFADYARLLTRSPRYADVAGHGDDVPGFARALQRAGYATDPSYADKLSAIANSAPMRSLLAALGAADAAPKTTSNTVDAADSSTHSSPSSASAAWPSAPPFWAAP